MKRFLAKLLIFLSPFLVVVALYFIKDPFKVLYHYKSYYENGKPLYIVVNRDYVSKETFDNNYPKYNYDSYIFGNSRSGFYQVSEWQKHINSVNTFHFDASGESVYGIEKKLQYLDDKGAGILNALFIMDAEILSQAENNKTYLYIKHPELSGQSRLSYQFYFFKSYLDPAFLCAYLDFTITGKVKPYMKEGNTIDDRILDYDLQHNEMYLGQFDEVILRNPDSFYLARKDIFYNRDTMNHHSPPVIKEKQLILLNRIKQILSIHHTNYKIVISPLYDQKKLNELDRQQLVKIFGSGNVFDFSGVNEITGNIRNYYEDSHYLPAVANKIMDSIYKF